MEVLDMKEDIFNGNIKKEYINYVKFSLAFASLHLQNAHDSSYHSSKITCLNNFCDSIPHFPKLCKKGLFNFLLKNSAVPENSGVSGNI